MKPMRGPRSFPALRPLPDAAGECPRDGSPLEAERIHLPGWRMLLEGRCPACGHWYLQDLPVGHGLVYPATLDLDTGETFAPDGSDWFSGWLEPRWRTPSEQAVELEVTGPGARRPAVLLNCLDPIYGHSLLKLLNAQRHLEEDERDVVVLVPRALAHLVPDAVAETWTVEGPPSLAWQWLLRLDERLQRELDRLGDVIASPAFPHPHPTTWSLDTFVGDVPPERRGQPSFVFAFRDDRPWGLTARHQELNLRALWSLLRRRFPEAGGALIGVGEPGRAPAGLDDLRVARPVADDERSWLAAARGADMVIGVHGSHLLLPSGLADLTLELTPANRHVNVFQATLVTEPDPVLALWRYRPILGGAHLGDVTPARVASVAEGMLRDNDRFAALMAGHVAGVDVPRHDDALAGPPENQTSAAPPGVRQRARGAAGHVRDSARRRVAAARAPSPPAVLTDRRGLRFELETDEEVANFIQHGGHFETAELDFFAQRPLQGVAIDVGANIGAFTAVLARGVGPGGQVHAFEPLPTNRRRLERTLALNELGNVTIHPAAVADREGTAELATYGPGYESWASLARGDVDLPTERLQPVERIEAPTVS
ncbi:MAG: hypothetical protein QOF37_1722, partial [Thermoleophilaceae bacterium]|nr:hypothetical protein [Thermoleophilaceae bacterium]